MTVHLWRWLQASSSGATAPAGRSIIARKPPQARRPKTDELGDIRVDYLSRGPGGNVQRPRAEVRAEFAEKNSLCTCASGVPAFLCRCVQCFAFEIGACDPEIGHWDWYRRGKHPSRCDCIPWEKIRDDPYDVRCKRPCEEEGDILWQLDSISARRNGRACGRMELCVHCDGAGTYIRRCTAEDCKRVARGRSILVLGNDVAVACAIKCKGHGPDRRSCGLEGLPDVVIDRRVVNC